VKTYKQFYRDFQYITEIKMSRVLKHFTQEEYPVGIITAFRGGLDRKTNISNNKSLASFLRSKNYGFVYVDGAWIENQGKKNEKSVSEDSIFVMAPEGTSFDEFSNNLQSQAKKYDQDAFLAYDHENKIVKIIDKNGVVEFTLKKFRLGQAADAFTRLRKNGNNGNFFFERFRHPINWITRMALTSKDTSEVML
tara:strand:- start:54 stop:635 length:582 start_codon:yes stop_codon:yes gene_type:complete